MSEPEPESQAALYPFPGEPPGGSPFLNRELSWLEFNRRVLTEAEDADNPLLERLKFVAIFDGNLDEFFMKRVGGLRQQLASVVRELPPDGHGPREQLAAISRVVRPMIARQRQLLQAELLPELKEQGLEIVSWGDLRAGERRHLCEEFERSLFPVLTPLAVDPAHPFPFISNLSLSLAVSVRHPESEPLRFARVKVPQTLARWLQLPHSLRFVPVEEVIAHNLERLFPGMEIVDCHPFRVTRSADVQRNEETADDLLEAIQEELRERRFSSVVRLELVPGCPRWMRALLCEELEVHEEDVFEVAPPLALRDLMHLTATLPACRPRAWNPVTHPRLHGKAGEAADIFQVIAEGDLLVHHPYDSFATSVQELVGRAAQDPAVVAIKQTLYRTSPDSPIMQSLIRAAESRKQVAVTIEIKARFDEAANMEWAEALEKVGAHVAYGLVGLKTHAKVCLIVRHERDGLRCYTHLASGNYNAETAKHYTDLGLLTCSPQIARDVVQLFNLLTGYVHRPRFDKLLVAPVNMRQRFLELIAREVEHARAGHGGHLIAKMNGLDDPQLVEALYDASAAGVEVDLIVRGICRLRPGLPGRSETVRVLSIVGRFLEHSRIYYFANAGSPELFIGSADWMTRNFDHRVEAAVPVEEPRLQEELRAVLDFQLADNVKAWELREDGVYVRRQPGPGEEPRNSQEALMQRALERAGRAG